MPPLPWRRFNHHVGGSLWNRLHGQASASMGRARRVRRGNTWLQGRSLVGSLQPPASSVPASRCRPLSQPNAELVSQEGHGPADCFAIPLGRWLKLALRRIVAALKAKGSEPAI